MNTFIKDKINLKAIAIVILIVIAFIFFLTGNKNKEDQIEIIINDPIEECDDGPKEVSVEKMETIVIEVAGEVNSPSVYILPAGSRVYEAIDAAGGLTESADTRNTNLASTLHDELKIYIPSIKEVETIERQTGQPAGSDFIGGGKSQTAQKNGLININTASSEELQQLSGVGPATADKIINYRNEYGGFKRTEDLKNVSGVGEKTFNKLKNLITVE